MNEEEKERKVDLLEIMTRLRRRWKEEEEKKNGESARAD
jgi:hypothetical protein